MSLPYFDVLEKHIDTWFKDGWLVYGIIGLVILLTYTVIRVFSQ